MKRNWKHILIIISYFVFSQILITEIPTLLADKLNLYITISTIKVSLYFVYLMLVFLNLRKEHISLPDFGSYQKTPVFLWLMVLLGSFIFLWLMEFFIFIAAMFNIIEATFKIIVISTTLAPFIFINTILIMALKKPLIFYVHQNSSSWSMKEDEQNKYIHGFIKLMEKENAYKDAELTLNKISELLNINPKYLSLILNKHLHGSFPDIVNKYRIISSRQLLENSCDMTIQQIMYEVGYNSKSAFNKHFKRIAGCTPSEYKEKIQNKK